MRNLCLSIVFGMMSIVCMAQANSVLWYDKPADNWWEALPVGNGRLAAMVYGGTAVEEIQFNEETFWAGGPYVNNSREGLPHLQEVRNLIFQGQNKEAEKILDRYFLTGQNGMRYLPLASLVLEMPDGKSDKTLSNSLPPQTADFRPCRKSDKILSNSLPPQTADYRRELSLDDAIATTRFKHVASSVTYERKVFASLSQPVIIVTMKSSKPKALDLLVSMRPAMPSARSSANHNQLRLICDGVSQEGVPAALRAVALLEAESDGVQTVENEKLKISKATQLTLYLTAATNYVNFQDVSGNPERQTENTLNVVRGKSVDALMAEHISLYHKQFNRVSLQLPSTSQSQLPTDQRIKKYSQGGDEALAAMLFQYGRYLLISSSQPGCQPANLQGKWNHNPKAAWDSKYTTNINLEMNYWMADVAALPECQEPLFSLIKDVSVTGAETARILWGARGWVLHHNTDLWRATGPVDAAKYGIWPNGGGWLVQHLWQHYLFTGDKSFLRKWYPVMKGAADFYISHLVRHPQHPWLVTVPSMSPEHGPEGTNTSITAGCTMDNQIAYDVLENTRQAAEILGADVNYCDTLQHITAQLPPMQIGQYGQLQEWIQDADDPNDTHRHVSHLYGLYPSNQIGRYSTPELFEAAKTTLVQRGDMATGWSLSWKLCFWSRLQDGNHVYKIIRNLINILPNDSVQKQYPNGRTYPNMLTAHPPFQIDCNLGYTAGVAEMLLQSHDGAVHLLPALPDAWADGKVKGLHARGGFVVDMQWNCGKIQKAVVHSTIGGVLRLRSAVPLYGEGLVKAKGECPNLLFRSSRIRQPLVNTSPLIHKPLPLETYEYDLETIPGRSYNIRSGE